MTYKTKLIPILFIIYTAVAITFFVWQYFDLRKTIIPKVSSSIPVLEKEKLNSLYNLLSEREKLNYQDSEINLKDYNFGKAEPFKAQEK